MKRANRGWLVLTLTAGALLPVAGWGTEHPRLVDLATTRCTTCHEDLLEGKAVVHPPVADDCTNCHDMTLGDEGTTVELMEPEPQLCVFCHADKEAGLNAELKTPHFPVTDSCLTCHDPHASDHPNVLVEPLVELCSICHDLAPLQEVHGDQLTDATDCTACHQPHGSDNVRLLKASKLHPPFAEGSCEACHRQPFGARIRLRARGEKLCEACHGEMGSEGRDGGTVHAALQGERGRAGCLSCHNPHMSDQRRLLNLPNPPLCGQCHGEIVKAAQAPSGHFPASEDCLNCHQPHASEQVRLLNQPPAELCVFCHDTGDEELVGAHLGANLERLTCIACHTPHGSGNMKLLAANLHPPVEDGCDICHDGAYNKFLEGGPPDLCLFCHDDIQEIIDTAQVPHGALELGTCTDCHNPHASPQERLVKAPGAGPCADCHDEKVPGPEEAGHGVIDLIGCRACHEPHGGSREALLRAEPPGLCLSCHNPRNVRIDEEAGTALLLNHFEVPAQVARGIASLRLSADGQREHPVAGHRVQGEPTEEELRGVEVTFEGELTCLSCHDPHKGRVSLLKWNAASTLEACLHCHPKG